MLESFYKLLPGKVKEKLSAKIKRQITIARQKESKSIPKTELAERHVKNLKIVVTRDELIKLLPHGAVVAEVGVDKGEFSEKIWKETAPVKYHLVDMWGSERYHEGLMDIVKQRFHTQIEASSIEINRGFSTEVGKQFPDEYFDWIYIDTDHSYKTTREEIEVYAPKMKKGGVIAGHDFVIGNWDGDVRYGVIEAVYEFCVKNDWEMIFLTAEMTPSFAIRKIMP